jgi:hypothetical protein
LHVSQCDGIHCQEDCCDPPSLANEVAADHCGRGANHSAKPKASACGCHHDHDAVSATLKSVPPNHLAVEGSVTHGGGHSHDGHNHDTCAICQSLSVPCGVAWVAITIRSQRLCLPVVLFAVVTLTSEFLCVNAPRGPPGIA